MRKLLLGTSALVGATALVAVASAAAPELTISGNYNIRLVGGENQATGDTVSDVGAGGRDNGYKFSSANSQAEIRFRAKGESDDGIRYGVNMDYRYLANATDEAYVFVGGDFGTVHLGHDDGAYDAFGVGGHSVGVGTYGIDGWDLFLAHDVINSADNAKVSYFSNDFGGFTFGVSWGDGFGDYEDVIEAGAKFSQSYDDFSFSIGANYIAGAANTSAPSVDITTHTRGSGAASTDTSSSNKRTIDDLAAYGAGVTFGFGGLSVGLGFADSGDTGTIAASHLNAALVAAYDVDAFANVNDESTVVTAGGNTVLATGASADDGQVNINKASFVGQDVEGESVTTLGVAYDIGGGMAVSWTYAASEKSTWQLASAGNAVSANALRGVSASVGNGFIGYVADEETTLMAIDFGFPIMDGMVGYAALGFSNYERSGFSRTFTAEQSATSVADYGRNIAADAEFSKAAVDVDATTYVIGTTISF